MSYLAALFEIVINFVLVVLLFLAAGAILSHLASYMKNRE